MDISTVIIPGRSLGGISIGEQTDDVILRLSEGYIITRGLNCTSINEGLISIYHNEAGIISALSCNSSFPGRYSSKLWPGMTVLDVIKNTTTQVAWAGYVMVDNLEGVGLSLPEERDDFENILDEFDVDYIFEELWVYAH